jgi:hypothetical protein
MQPFLTKCGHAGCLLLLFVLGDVAQAQTSLSIYDRVTPADEDRINQVLARRGSLDVVDMPLKDVVQLLRDRFQENIVISAKKLEEAAVGLDTPMTARLEHLPLESILHIILREIELGFTVRDNVILISTPDELYSPDMQETRVYPVRDLVHHPEYGDDCDPLIELITTTIDPQSWDEVGGPSSISYLEPTGTLVLTQSWHSHRKIERLIDTVRRANSGQGAAPNGSLISSSVRIASHASAATPRRYLGATGQSWQMPHVHPNE